MSREIIFDLYSLDDCVAVVTGGGSGIGAAARELFTELGATVAVFDRDGDAIDSLPEDQYGHVVDITHEDSVRGAVHDVFERHGRIDILVNCAGIAIREAAVDQSLEHWNTVINVNQTGTFICSRHAAIKMRKNGGGRIINVASTMGLSGGGIYPNISYQTTKGAVVNMTRALAVEWAGDNILVNAVAPTYVDTLLTRELLKQPGIESRIKNLTPLGRLATPREVACSIAFLASRASSMITGHILAVDGGFLAQ